MDFVSLFKIDQKESYSLKWYLKIQFLTSKTDFRPYKKESLWYEHHTIFLELS